MAITTVIHTNEQSIDRVLAAGAPVLLVFWSRSAPIPSGVDAELDKLAQRYAGKALIAKVDAEEQRRLVSRFNAALPPSAVLVRNGKAEATLRSDDLARAAAWLSYAVEGAPRPAQAAQAQPQSSPRAGAQPGKGDAKAATQPVTLTDANFQQVVSGPGPVLVDFWAPWCGPCRMVAPSVEQLAREFAGRAVVGKLNVDENPVTQARYRIMSIPTLCIFKNGQVVDQLVGAQPYGVLQQRLARQVGA